MQRFPDTPNVEVVSGAVSLRDTAEAAFDFAPGGFRTGAASTDAFRPSEATAAPSAAAPAPLPKRPKGRLFVGAMLLVICGLVGHGLWATFFRHTAYGLLTGNVATISAPWDGYVVESQVRESESFEQSQVLATIDSLAIRQRLDRLSDNLRFAQAELDAGVSRLRWNAQSQLELSSRTIAQHHEAQGALAAQQTLLEQYQRDRARSVELASQQAISAEDQDAAVFSELAQRRKVADMKSSAAMWKTRAELVQSFHDSGQDQLAPQLATIENLKSEIARLREFLDQGRLRAPFDSIVMARHRLTGERVEAGQPIVEMLQSGSLEVVLFLTQKDSPRLRVGDETEVEVEPVPNRIRCRVVRIGGRLCTAPPAIERHYWSQEPLLPVYLKPVSCRDERLLRPGSVVKW